MPKIVSNPDHKKARAYFRRLLSSEAGRPETRLLVVAHLVDSAIAFLPTLNETFPIEVLLGKPSSIQDNARAYLTAALPEKQFILDRDLVRSNPDQLIRESFPVATSSGVEGGIPTVIVDIGGYFAHKDVETGEVGLLMAQAALSERGYRLVGVVEDTMNGHKRYEDLLADPAFPDHPGFQIYSVARSPLKRPENHLVGVAITFSVEAVLRQSDIVLQSRRAGVIGFGPIGRSVAHALKSRGIPVSICEVDPIALAQAAAQGFPVYDYRHHFPDFLDRLNLVVSATGANASSSGQRPLNAETVAYIRPGTYVASVTSADDEVDIEGFKAAGYEPQEVPYNPDIMQWVRAGENGATTERGRTHQFYVMLNGNAVNFRHGGVVGPAIQLLQGEVIACINKIMSTEPSVNGVDHELPCPCPHCPGASQRLRVEELSESERRAVADAWLDHYMEDSSFDA